MTAPVPVTPTEAPCRLTYAHAAHVYPLPPQMRTTRCPGMVPCRPCSGTGVVAALPAEPATDARLAAGSFVANVDPDGDWNSAEDQEYDPVPADYAPLTEGEASLLARLHPAPPTEDDTERVERVAVPVEALRLLLDRYLSGDTTRDSVSDWAAADVQAAMTAPAQPDPATVERARAEGREQGLREAEQAVRDAWVYGHPVLVRAYRDGAVAAVRALSSATPSAPEGTDDRG